jgi:hypothetical protein
MPHISASQLIAGEYIKMNWLQRAAGRSVVPLSACVVLMQVQAAWAMDIYKWVGDGGVTHYSNKKPAGVAYTLMPEGRLSIIPGDRIGAEAAKAARNERVRRQDPGESSARTEEEAIAGRREKMLKQCRANNGVDCEREVDTELRAEALQQGSFVRRLAPPATAGGNTGAPR